MRMTNAAGLTLGVLPATTSLLQAQTIPEYKSIAEKWDRDAATLSAMFPQYPCGNVEFESDEISAPVQPGNSGGPLFDQSGNVIGVVVGKLDALKIASITSDIPQNVNFAIRASVVASFLDSANVPYASGQTGDRLSAADIAERARGFTVQIECRK